MLKYINALKKIEVDCKVNIFDRFNNMSDHKS